MAEAQGHAQDSEEVYNIKRAAVDAAYNAAEQLSGKERIQALQDCISKEGELTGAVVKYGETTKGVFGDVIGGNTTILTQEQATAAAYSRTKDMLGQIADEQKKMVAAKQAQIDKDKQWADALKSQMDTAKAQMVEFTKLISAISELIAKLDKVIVLSVNDQASGPLRAIKAAEDAIQDKTVTISVNQQNQQPGPAPSPLQPTPAWTAPGGGTVSTGDRTIYVPPPGTSGGYDTGGAGYDLSGIGAEYGYAMGDAFNLGNIIPFGRGGIFDTPTFFPMASGMGLMGEAGPEAVMPLTRGKDGKLGVKASGGQVINLGGITIIGGDKSPEQLAREIVKPLKVELRRLSAVGA
jgi:hypothetical protein